MKGERVAKDTVQAVKWFRQAADQGDASAQLNLGYCSATGQGVAPDPVEAVKWLRKAADQGQSDAQYSLGECYASGQGVKKDAVEAADWYRKAAEQGHPEAQAMLKLRSPSRLAGLGLIAVLVGGGAVVWYFRRR